ncbi:hypothetical protein DVA44_17015 [Leclercia sp. W17]|nr:hypothetical protein DVA43_11120 [Leclercia sp. W6]AXF65684.1 hypothetical protein DVA44_17015 [Leclercia sp. W17]
MLRLKTSGTSFKIRIQQLQEQNYPSHHAHTPLLGSGALPLTYLSAACRQWALVYVDVLRS